MTHSRFQISLSELLFVTLFAGLGLAAMRAGGVLASLTLVANFLMLLALGIVACVRKDRWRAFAIDFVVPVVAYGALVRSQGTELDPYAAGLPFSTLILRPTYAALVKTAYIDLKTGQTLVDYDPTLPTNGTMSGMLGVGSSIQVGYSVTPDPQYLMLLGHSLIGMFLGYFGARFALMVKERERVPTDNGART